MFAEDVELLPRDSFLNLMEKVKDSPEGFSVMLQTLWRDMATGTKFSTVLLNAVPHFNGGLFEDTTALPLRPDQMALLIHAAKSDWSAASTLPRAPEGSSLTAQHYTHFARPSNKPSEPLRGSRSQGLYISSSIRQCDDELVFR